MRETDQIRDIPPSAKLVLKVLEYDSELTRQELVNNTRLAQRSVRDAFGRRIDEGIDEKTLSVPDVRQNLYTTTIVTESEPAEPSTA